MCYNLLYMEWEYKQIGQLIPRDVCEWACEPAGTNTPPQIYAGQTVAICKPRTHGVV